MAIPIIGSMAIKGVFQAGSLLSGLGTTSTKLKEVQQRSKSTSTEMKRMTGQAGMLKTALAAIGVAGFTALLMTTPQLAGALAKIKSEMQRIAWAIGKHLKPALDAVATILRGIRTGSWATVVTGIKELTDAAWGLVATAGEWVIDLVFGKGTYSTLEEDFLRWKKNLEDAWGELDLKLIFKVGVVEPIKWISEKLGNYQRSMMEDLEGEWGKEKGKRHREFWGGLAESIAAFQRGTFEEGSGVPGRQTGGYIPREGLYHLHAGETVTMRGSTPGGNAGGPTEINIDFSGANINLASGIELDQFAEVISNRIAERQHSLTY